MSDIEDAYRDASQGKERGGELFRNYFDFHFYFNTVVYFLLS